MNKPRLTIPYVVYGRTDEPIAAVLVEYPARFPPKRPPTDIKHTTMLDIRARFGGKRVKEITEAEWGTLCAIDLAPTFKGHFIKNGTLDIVSIQR